jgi:signal transduction histidine kinase
VELRPGYTKAYQNLAKLYFRWVGEGRLLEGVRHLAAAGGGRTPEVLHRFVLALVEFTRRDAYEDFYGRGHRLKNLLAILESRISRLQRRMAGGEGTPAEHTAEVSSLGRGVAEATGELRAYLDVIRPTAAAPQPVDLNATVLAVAARLREGLAPGGRLNVDLAADVPRVSGAPGALDEAVMNLARNAVEAVGAHGTVALTTCFDPARVEALVAVEDSGPGILPDIRRELFRPGFTTKPGGSGLGLVLVQRAVQDSGGTVAVDRADLGGARFLVRIPAVEGAGGVAGRGLSERPVSLRDTNSLFADELTR